MVPVTQVGMNFMLWSHQVRSTGPTKDPCLCGLQHLGTVGELRRVLTLFLFQPGAERLPSQELTHLLLQEVRYE